MCTPAEVLEQRQLLSSTLLGQSLFPADNPWNQDISQAPVAANSAAIISHIGSSIRLHPDWGEDNPANTGDPLYGIPYNVVHGNSTPKINVIIDNYPDESDLVAVPIPSQAVLEGDYQSGPNLNGGGYLANQRGDSHLIIWDQDNSIAYELYGVTRPADPTLFPDDNDVELPHTDGLWHAAQETVWNMKTNTFRTLGATSADAAGLSILAGLARPDEALPVSQGGQGAITHALRFTLPRGDVNPQYVYPASHKVSVTAGSTNLPLGSRLRLANNATVNAVINTMPPQSQIIARAMQKYGLILADIGSAMYITGTSASVDANNQISQTWNVNDIFASNGLKALTAGNFEVVDLRPIVTGLSATSGAAGTTITITGQNFSGAAGHLSVLFGTTPATTVTYVNDTQWTAVVPAGTGTVSVTVQSGVKETDQISSSPNANVNAPIFGYGTSVVTTASQYTYASSADLVNTTPKTTVSAVEGINTGSITLATFTDADPSALLSAFKASVIWGGTVVGSPVVSVAYVGKTGTTSQWKVVGSVVYAKPGTYVPTVKISDSDGNSLQTTDTTIRVQDAVLTDTTVATTYATTEGRTTGTVVLATFTDANPLSTNSDFSVKVNWNGTVIGTPTVSVIVVSRTATATLCKVTGSAAYANAGLYRPTVSVFDVDGSTLTSSKTSFKVADAALTDTTVAATLQAKRLLATGNVVVATFSDANPYASSSDFTATINWGGATTGTPTWSVVLVSRTTSSSTWKVVGNVTYTAVGTFAVTVNMADVDGMKLVSKRIKFQVTG
ncbi:MAG: IPT/TIG domain-containing protein [Planctomycetes bacterium]|nr:IPT/TIG domain-containing protein [Planctomycetota bacterium]